jgi:hypothetical protein
MYNLGLATKFCSKKIPRNRLGMVSVIPRKKALIPRHSKFTTELIPRLGTAGNGMKKLVLQKIMLQQTCAVCTMFLSETASERNSKSLHIFLFHRMEFRVVFSSGEWLGTELQVFASIFVPPNGITSYFLYLRKVQNRIPSLLLLVKNSEHFSPLPYSAEQPEFRQNKQIVPPIPTSAE